MRVNKPVLHPMAQSALVEIQAAGVAITPEMVLWVQDAAARIASHPERPPADLVDWPTEAGGVLLYPLSFGAASWLQGLSERMRYDVRVIAFAAANSKRPERLIALRWPVVAFAAVLAWILTVRCSHAALTVAVDHILGMESTFEVDDVQKRPEPDNSWEWGAMIRALCARYPGTSPEYWMWDVSREKAAAMLRQDVYEKDAPGVVSDHEKEMTVQFRSIIEHLKAGKPYG